MSRTAKITKDDVRAARNALRAGGLAHGITAIRNHIGCGSPQLITRFIRELDGSGDQRAVGITHEKANLAGISEAVAGALNSEPAERTQPTSAMATQEDPSAYIAARHQKIMREGLVSERLSDEISELERELTTARAQNAQLTVQVQSLEHELDAQRQMFKSWQRDQVYERALLLTRLEQLSLAIHGRNTQRIASPKGGEQLDLY